ncbi:pyridoxal-dependent decarboxylase [Altererythrobacter arenosus]|uniref:Pyridoxal-dependent decarboxylase n=1 Tax=Altererythrobacter arenosus TaxID=3032592 RepID=A0ABY8FZG8_9SPHN|nr:pyridoxal-dependent decarboxylase [Altererythrobacter sp. CAU 1644]WFL78781.1 pyridoxal-dependent decarboxylase [Altererythrobacter sp. CAU 1644]
MNNEDFRAAGHAMVDWIADYFANIESYPVRAQVKPGEIAAKLPASAPESGTAMAEIMADFERDIMPGITHWQHPSFFAYFPANASPPSVLAEFLTAAIAAQCMLWQTSPAANEMEGRVLDWLAQLIGLPEGFRGVIQDSATSATLVALLTAREQASGWRGNDAGLFALGAEGQRFAVYCSEESHSSIEKGLKVIGLGRDNLRKIAVNDDLSIDLEVLARTVAEDRAVGITPLAIVAALGGTGTGAIDPLRPLGEFARAEKVWLHVDGAWAGSALICPELHHLIDGIELADSLVFNPHKWLFTNFDCSAYYVRDAGALERTLALVPEYLKSRESDQVTDYQNWSVPLGRRFRALKLWFVLRSYGAEGLREKIRAHMTLAAALYAKVVAAEDFEITSPLRLSLFSFRYRPKGVTEDQLDAVNEELLARLNDSGRIYLTQNRFRGRFVIRFQVGGQMTETRHVEEAWELIQQVARGMEPQG